MRNVSFDCVVTCDLTPTLELQELEVDLQQSGKDWKGSITVGVDHMVLIHCYAAGITGEDWSIAVTTHCPTGTPDKIYVYSDTIPHGGAYEFYLQAKVPDTLCGAAATN